MSVFTVIIESHKDIPDLFNKAGLGRLLNMDEANGVEIQNRQDGFRITMNSDQFRALAAKDALDPGIVDAFKKADERESPAMESSVKVREPDGVLVTLRKYDFPG